MNERATAHPGIDFSADLLVSNGTVITMDAAGTQIAAGAVAIADGTIKAAGPAAELDGWHAAQRIDACGGLIMPGLINTHTHAAMALFRGLADDLPLMTWLNDHIFPAEARLNADMVGIGTRLACAEMIRAGITCFCDMYLFEEAVAEVARQCAMRAVVGEVLYDFPSPNYGPIAKGFDYTARMLARWAGDALITVAVEPHSPYLCAPDLLTRAARLAADYQAPLVIHLSETTSEVAQIQERYHATPVGHLERLGILAPNLVACHAVVLTPADIALLAQHDVKVSHNPESNMKLASGVAPVPDLLAAGVCVGLGTDGCASNNNLDLFGEMDMAAKLHKVHRLNPTVMPAAAVLRMSTIDAARVLGLHHKVGSIEVGKRADLIVIDTDQPHLTPMYDPISHLVYAVQGSDVRHTIIDGRVVMQDRRLVTIDLAKTLSDARQQAGWIADVGHAHS
ncbi:MAG: S-adenosylhomocysteine deaminase [Desulfatitalea sp. BRH_c12]|nr:MAG: S-adenosylhomocysteine deaminase [Desulfatitalea sp. BRH_c12]